MSKMPKKFAIIGTSCSGKTALFERLSIVLPQKYPEIDFGFVPEAARAYLQSVTISYPPELKHHLAIEKLAYEQEKKYGENKEILICDRSVLDSVCYIREFIGQEEANELLTKIKEWLTTYTYFFLLDPSDVPYGKDEVRRESQEVRDHVHELFLDYLVKETLPYGLISGTLPQRENKVTAYLATYL